VATSNAALLEAGSNTESTGYRSALESILSICETQIDDLESGEFIAQGSNPSILPSFHCIILIQN
jgi:hypothetical protein